MACTVPFGCVDIAAKADGVGISDILWSERGMIMLLRTQHMRILGGLTPFPMRHETLMYATLWSLNLT